MRKNVTITLTEETARWVRVEAAKRDTSVSAFLGSLLEEQRRRAGEYERAKSRFMARPALVLNEAGAPYPSRDSLHERKATRA
jgi:hypothetical protein